ncbi:MAG: uracil-DNA glycosylase [Spirochaetaceae bacterium]|nr:uracil-DNA glycosylase [Spirochaetaceae bacterium]
MESNKDLKKDKLNNSLNKLLNLFDEGQAILKGDPLPSEPIKHDSYDLSSLVETILDPNKKLEVSPPKEFKTNNSSQSSPSEVHNRASAFEEFRKRVNINTNKIQSTSINLQATVPKENLNKLQNSLFEIPKDDNSSIKYFSCDYSDKYFAKVSQFNSNFNNVDNSISDSNYSQLQIRAKSCRDCVAYKIRKNTIFGEGSLGSKLLVIGEGPGEYEDNSGEIFVGPSGQFLEKWLKAINLDMRKEVYLTNIVKCYSGNNPTSDMVNSCKNYLKREIQLVAPSAILVLGKVAANGLLENELSLSKLRNRPIYYNGIPVVVTYHPSAVLRNPNEWKRPAWEDVKRVAKLLDSSASSITRSN